LGRDILSSLKVSTSRATKATTTESEMRIPLLMPRDIESAGTKKIGSRKMRAIRLR